VRPLASLRQQACNRKQRTDQSAANPLELPTVEKSLVAFLTRRRLHVSRDPRRKQPQSKSGQSLFSGSKIFLAGFLK
jgi:hypothetical protein